MNTFQVFTLQGVMSFVTLILIAKFYVLPAVGRMPLYRAVVPLLLVHMVRHLGLTLLVDGVHDPDLPLAFRYMLGYGDFICELLALVAILAVRANLDRAYLAVWCFNIVGFVDFINVAIQGWRYDATQYELGATWYVAVTLTPTLIVSHVLIFILLVRHARGQLALRDA